MLVLMQKYRKNQLIGIFTDTYNPKGRVFAKLIYTVNTQEQQFTPSEVIALKALTNLALTSEIIPLTVTFSNETTSNNESIKTNIIYEYEKDNTGNYQIIQDINDINKIDGDKDYLLNINRICLQCRKL